MQEYELPHTIHQQEDLFFDRLKMEFTLRESQDEVKYCEILRLPSLLQDEFQVTNIKEAIDSDICSVILKEKYITLIIKRNQDKILHINVEFCYLKIIKNESGQKVGFSLSRGANVYHFAAFNKESYQTIRNWVHQLNLYTIRTDAFQKYQINDLIGNGSQARVYLATKNHQNNILDNPKFYALKSFSKKGRREDQDMVDQLIVDEVRNQRLLRNCEFVPQLLKIFENDDSIDLLMDYVGSGTLSQIIMTQNLLRENELLAIFRQLLKALEYFRRFKIIHRDLKPDNILINQNDSEDGPTWEVYIIDFGFSIIKKKGDYQDYLCGTPGYFAPEYLENNEYGSKSDIFSMGVIFYNLLTGKNLFCASEVNELLRQNRECDLPNVREKLQSYSVDIQDLVIQMLAKNKYLRSSAAEALENGCFQILKQLKIPQGNLQAITRSTFVRTTLNAQQYLNFQSQSKNPMIHVEYQPQIQMKASDNKLVLHSIINEDSENETMDTNEIPNEFFSKGQQGIHFLPESVEQTFRLSLNNQPLRKRNFY